MRMAERAMAQARGAAAGRAGLGRGRRSRSDPRGAHRGQAADRQEPGHLRASCAALSAAMQLDLLLFGRIRSGPFFALLVKD